MSCVPDFDNMVWFSMLYLWSGGLVYLLWILDEDLRHHGRKKVCMVWACFCTVASLGGYRYVEGDILLKRVCYLLLLVYLVVCSVQDALTCMVSDFLQFIGLMGGGILIFNSIPSAEIGVSLTLFAIIQWFLFMRMYGQADGMTFLICALYLAAEGRDIEGYLLHMAMAFAMLAVVQLLRRNISGRGDLKTPVALLPYIMVSFLLVI